MNMEKGGWLAIRISMRRLGLWEGKTEMNEKTEMIRADASTTSANVGHSERTLFILTHTWRFCFEMLFRNHTTLSITKVKWYLARYVWRT